MKKSERFKIIEEILITKEIKTQDDLVNELEERNIEVTQATISRDLKELKLVKVPSADEGYKYSLSSDYKENDFSSMIIKIEILDSMLSIKTNPGHAMLLKKLLQKEFDEYIFSIIADDDSLLLVAKRVEDAREIKSQLGGD